MTTYDITEAVAACIDKNYATADDIVWGGSFGIINHKDGRYTTGSKVTEARMQSFAATGDRDAAETAASAHYPPPDPYGSCRYCGMPLDRRANCDECGRDPL